MEKIQVVKVYSQDIDRVTTDATHRRIRLSKSSDKPKEILRRENGQNDYYCLECKQRLPATPGKEELKSHFETVQHKEQYCFCVYCSKPVYAYKWKRRLEVYHMCRDN